ncbi:unnamed protein product, partial [Lymnaea stagnalis]
MVNIPCLRTVTLICILHITAACRLPESVDIGGSCFWYTMTGKTYDEAKSFCEASDGVLPYINTSSQFYAIYNTLSVDTAWIGISDKMSPGTMAWEYTGNPVTELNTVWDDKEPNFGNTINCVYTSQRVIISTYCGDQMGSLCMEK